MLNAEAFEEYGKWLEKFEPWLNDGEEYQLLDMADWGLKEGAPEEAKIAYAEYVADYERRKASGRR